MKQKPPNPSPPAPPIVKSNPDFNGLSIQMPQPFGSGIIIKAPATNNHHVPVPQPKQPAKFPAQNVAIGFEVQAPSSPNYAQAPPMSQKSPYPNYAPRPTAPAPAGGAPYPRVYPPLHNFQSSQNTLPSAPFSHTNNQALLKASPSPNHSAPISYTQPNSNMRRSTSFYQVKFWMIQAID